MINQPNVDTLIRKLGTEDQPASRYALCVVVSKRSRQLIEDLHSRGEYEFADKEKEITEACLEIQKGKITYTKD